MLCIKIDIFSRRVYLYLGIPRPYPNVDFPSPYSLMSDGCIHASAQGWDLLMGALYNNYFSKVL
jgi:hypothetical protein